MPALDDYAAPLPVWILVCRVLNDAPAGVSATGIVAEVGRLAGRPVRPATVLAVLARMREDGTVSVREEQRHHKGARGRPFPVRIHTMTESGAELYAGALAVVFAFTATQRKDQHHGHPQEQEHRRQHRRR